MGKQRRRRRNKRYRRSRLTVPLRILSFLLICGAITAGLIVFFKVQTVTIQGNSRYTAEEILEVSGIETGENMFLLNKYAIRERITEELPYIQSVRFWRNLPDTIVIEVEECQPVAAVIQGESAWLVSQEGKILEEISAAQAEEYLQVGGCTLLMPTVSSYLALPQGTDENGVPKSNITKEQLMDLLQTLEERHMLANAARIDCSDRDKLVMDYAGRFQVEIPYDADFNKKLNALGQIIDQLQENETGTIILTMPDKGSFKPSS